MNGGVRDQPPVLVLGVGITVLGVIRCLGRRGIPLYVAGADDDIVTRSRWYRTLSGAADLSEANLPKFLESAPFERMVLLPCTDGWAMAVSALPASLAQRFPSSVVARDVLQRLVDKDRFAATLDELDLPHPQTHLVTDATLGSVPEEWIRDFFLKPTHSRPFARKFRVKAMRMRNRDELSRIFTETRGLRFNLMLQEYIPGPPTNHYFIEGFRDREGPFGALLARRRVRMYPLEFGNSTATTTIALSEAEPAAQSLKLLLERIGYHGIFSAEFKRDDRDGLFKILEVNARPWWFVEFAARSGVDVCERSYREALGEHRPAVLSYEIGRKCVYPRRDLECRHALARTPHPLSMMSMLRFWAGADQLTMSWDDPSPGTRELYKSARSRIRQLLRT